MLDLDKLFSQIKHDCSLYLEHNPHKSDYSNIEDYIELHEEIGNIDWISEEEKQLAIKNDSIWIIQWYPDTPTGSYSRAASSLNALINYVIKNEWR